MQTAMYNILQTRHASVNTGTRPKEAPVHCIVMPGYRMPPVFNRQDVKAAESALMNLTAAQIIAICKRALRE